MNNIMKKLFFCVLMTFMTSSILGQYYEVTSTTEKEQWVTQRKKFSSNDENNDNTKILVIDKDIKEQQMIGFGGCFNELGWEALKLLSNEECENVMNNLFHSTQANFNYNRFPIGASDYSNGFYSFNETKDDFEMINFSIARDKNCLIPYIRMAQKINPEMTFFCFSMVSSFLDESK